MEDNELIEILKEFEIFVDDNYGGSYQSVISYTKDKKISRAFSCFGALKIIDEFEKMQKEKQELIDYLKEEINECKLTGNDEDYIRLDVYEEILSKIGGNDK